MTLNEVSGSSPVEMAVAAGSAGCEIAANKDDQELFKSAAKATHELLTDFGAADNVFGHLANAVANGTGMTNHLFDFGAAFHDLKQDKFAWASSVKHLGLSASVVGSGISGINWAANHFGFNQLQTFNDKVAVPMSRAEIGRAHV